MRFHRLIAVIAALTLVTPAQAADRKPIVASSTGQLQQIPSSDTLSVPAAKITGISGSTQCVQASSAGLLSGTGAACGAGAGTVTTTGSPASGNLTKFSGATSVTSGDLSGDVTTSGTLTTTIASGAVSLSKIANAAANSKLLGSGAAGSGSPYTEITLGTNLTMSGTTLNAGSGAVANAVTFNTSGGAAAGTTFDGSVARTIDYSTVGAAKTGAVTGNGNTMATSRLLGRTTASTGAIEEITVGTGLSLSSGTLSATGGAGSVWNLQAGPLDNEAPSSSFATLDTRNAHPTLDFDASSAESAVFTFVLPTDYSGAGITVMLYWAGTSATSGNVMWQAALEAAAAGSQDTDSDGFATAQAFSAAAANGTSGVLTKSSLNISNGANMDSIAAGDMFRLKITRDAANGSDTMTGDAELMRVVVVSQ
jgi:hypothetical protein